MKDLFLIRYFIHVSSAMSWCQYVLEGRLQHDRTLWQENGSKDGTFTIHVCLQYDLSTMNIFYS